MDNLRHSMLVQRGMATGAVLRELTVTQVGAVDWFTVYPRNLGLIYEEGLCLPVLRMKNLCVDAILRYLHMRALDIMGDADEPTLAPADASWLCFSPHTQLDAFLYVGPPQSAIFFDSTLSPRGANYAIAHEVGGYLADLLEEYSELMSPPSRQCAVLWDTFLPTPEQHQIWLELRALPRILTPQHADLPSSALNLAIQRATPDEVVARELLAPWSEVADIYLAGTGAERHEMIALLMQRYGLPALVAARYCNDLRTLLSSEPGPPDQPAPRPPSTRQGMHWGAETNDDSEQESE